MTDKFSEKLRLQPSSTILLLGGTTESLQITKALSHRGFQVLVSQATSVQLELPALQGVTFRTGPLNARDMADLLRSKSIHAVIDCTHPYAELVSANAFQAASECLIPFIVYQRPAISEHTRGIMWAGDHIHAARMAFDLNGIVFLSIGSNNIHIYAHQFQSCITRLIARILPGQTFREKCLAAGLSMQQIIEARGPFTRKENQKHFHDSAAGTLITKDSGEAGGVNSKLEAAHTLGMNVIVIKRPPRPGRLIFNSINKLISFVDQNCYFIDANLVIKSGKGADVRYKARV
ncbi:precorrin-6A reductase [Desulfonatronovibrio magnus]|uniref:precorrin-6A reductase n=1 Tax=Desulfonatronovibrio magnus TaxID=698827 RepID=UPI0018DE967B|nr:precorrin-6A reductase [Desulfonatronovibrio magnus]